VLIGIPRLRRAPCVAVAVALTCSGTPLGALTRLSTGDSTLSVEGACVVEGDSGVTHAPFVFRLSRPIDRDLHVGYSTRDLAAQAGSDYAPTSGTLTIPAGFVTGTILVPVFGDSVVETNETFALRITNAETVDVAESTAVDTIADDEHPRFERSKVALLPYEYGTLPPAWGDYDQDGDEDLPLYEREGTLSFAEMPGFRELLGEGNYHGAAWCDFDRDGWLDLVILPYAESASDSSRMHLLRGGPDHTFSDVAPSLGMDIAGNGETAVWGDFDGDGRPDLFTPFYAHIPPHRSFLWRNHGDGTFQEVAVSAGVALSDVPESLKPEGATAVDWNGDGALDLYCASHLFVNYGSMHFLDVREKVGLPQVFDECAQFVDYDNDGDFDLCLRSFTGPRLFRNTGGRFEEVTQQAGMPTTTYCLGDRFVDVDNDGDLDLFVPRCGEPSLLMINRGDGTFESDSAFAALDVEGGLNAWADVDHDGDMDFVIWNGRWELWLNRLDRIAGEDRSFLRVRVLDAGGHETANGATVRLFAPDHSTQSRIVDGGSGYVTQCEYTVQFAAPGSGPYRLEIDYPNVPGARFIVDEHTNSALGNIDPGAFPRRTIDVWKDGRIVSHPTPVAAAPRDPEPARTTALGMPRPLPAPSRVTLPFTLAHPARVVLEIHDLAGRSVARLDLGARPAGSQDARWDLLDRDRRPVRAGIYFVSLAVDGAAAGSRRVVIAR
jgi:hypothetical protein